MEQLLAPAQKVLEKNWRNGFTIPTSNLYPFQWNWDSGFIALGHYFKDPRMAAKELETLFSGQWENGLIPHIVFHSENEKTYFPNHDFWNAAVNSGAPQKPKTSGITQPAVHGFILENLLKKAPDNTYLRDFAKWLFPKIVHYHRFLYTYRDPNREGLMFIFHPWESGRDNSPLWDESLNRIQIKPGDLPSYQRRDTSIADPAERPTQEQYDRYVYLLLLGKRYQYDGKEIAEESPFLVQDDMMNALLIRSNQGLINIGKQLGLDTGEIEEWQQQSSKTFREKCWNPALGLFSSYDLRAEKQMSAKEIGGVIPLFAGLANEEQARQISDYLQSLHNRGFYLCPSYDVDSAYYDSCRYWRGPIWPHMNWMICRGLQQYGFNDLADIVKEDTFELVQQLGFFEYFEPEKAKAQKLDKGFGGDHFSWTASSIIDLIHHP